METLKPVEVSEYYINRVASEMSKFFWEEIFKEMFAILKDNTVINSKDDVIKAIMSGRIWYDKGAFRIEGRFSNSIAKTLEEMGAKFKNGAYYIPKTKIPMEYLQALGVTATKAAAKGNALVRFLSALAFKNIDLKPFIENTVKSMFKKLEIDILKSAQDKRVPVIELGIVQPKIELPKRETKNLEKYWQEQDKKAEKLRKEIEKSDKQGTDSSGLKEQLAELNRNAYTNAPTVQFDINKLELDAKSQKIAEDYTYNMQYWVKKWRAKDIVKMRKDILVMVQQGARIPRIEEYLRKRWKIAENKALFLATQESHLAGSVIQATNYQAMGCTSFRWLRSTSKEKRLLHKEYYGRTFRFDNPPIIDEKLGIKGLPRQIWNCKCQMSPIIPDVFEMMQNKKEFRKKYGIIEQIKNSVHNNKCDNNSWRYRRFGQGKTL